MKICSMCRKAFELRDGENLNYIQNKLICADCMQKIETLLTSGDADKVQEATNYIRSCRQQATDPQMVAYLKELLDDDTAVVVEPKAKEQPKKELKVKKQPMKTEAAPVQPSPEKNNVKEQPAQPKGNGLFGNVGSKIKSVAEIFCVLGIVVSVIAAIVLFASNSYRFPTIALGVICLIAGPLVSWLGSLGMYALGELVDNTRRNNELMEELLWETRNRKAPSAPSGNKK